MEVFCNPDRSYCRIRRKKSERNNGNSGSPKSISIIRNQTKSKPRKNKRESKTVSEVTRLDLRGC